MQTPSCLVTLKAPLVSLKVVRAIRGTSADSILAQVDEGRLRWVFDVSARGDGVCRELRFWSREVQEPKSVAEMELAEVVNELLGWRAEWRGPEIAQLLLVSRPTVHRLAGELAGRIQRGRIVCSRAAMVKFFEIRLQ